MKDGIQNPLVLVLCALAKAFRTWADMELLFKKGPRVYSSQTKNTEIEVVKFLSPVMTLFPREYMRIQSSYLLVECTKRRNKLKLG